MKQKAKWLKKFLTYMKVGKSTIDIVKIFHEEGVKTPAQYSQIPKYMKGNDYWGKSTITKILKNSTYIGNVIRTYNNNN